MTRAVSRLPAVRPVSAGQRPPDAIVWDDFDRPDASALGRPISGQADYTLELWSGSGSTAEIKGGKLRINVANPGTDLDNGFTATLRPPQVDIADAIWEVRGTQVVNGNGGNKRLALLFRVTDINNFYWGAYDGGAFRMYKRAAGVWTQIGSLAASLDNSEHAYRVTTTGPTLKLYFDNVLKLTVTDSAHASGGVGLAAWRQAAVVDFNNLQVRPL